MIRCACKKGFTLVELMIAASVLVVALCGLLILFNYCFVLSSLAGNVTVATAEAYGKLEEIRTRDYDTIYDMYTGSGATFNLVRLNGSGTITLSYVPNTSNKLLQAQIDVQWTAMKGRPVRLRIVSYIAER